MRWFYDRTVLIPHWRNSRITSPRSPRVWPRMPGCSTVPLQTALRRRLATAKGKVVAGIYRDTSIQAQLPESRAIPPPGFDHVSHSRMSSKAGLALDFVEPARARTGKHWKLRQPRKARFPFLQDRFHSANRIRRRGCCDDFAWDAAPNSGSLETWWGERG
jgi:hypothetical protein